MEISQEKLSFKQVITAVVTSVVFFGIELGDNYDVIVDSYTMADKVDGKFIIDVDNKTNNGFDIKTPIDFVGGELIYTIFIF